MAHTDRTAITTPAHRSRREFLTGLAAAWGLGMGLRGGAALSTGQASSTYTNPVFKGSVPDPCVLLHDGTYFAFGTTGPDRKADGRIFTVLRSKDLVDWQEIGGALTPPSSDTAYLYLGAGSCVRERHVLPLLLDGRQGRGEIRASRGDEPHAAGTV